MNFEESMRGLAPLLLDYAVDLLAAILILIIGWWLIKRVVRLVARQMEKRGLDLTVRDILMKTLSLVLKIILLIIIAARFGFNVLALVGVLSALALAIGLALQGHLSNFASGVLILIFRYYRIGDFIQVKGDGGTVKEIHIFHTVLEGLDNRLIIVPNGDVTSNAIHNFTAQGRRRHDLTVGISYAADIPKAKELILETIHGLPNLELDAGVDVFVKELADSSVNFAIRFVAANEHFWPAYKLFFERIKTTFDEHGIGIPFPQMDVHLRREVE